MLKIMTLLLCIALMFSFVACKQTNADDEDVGSKQLFVSQIEITDDNSQQTTTSGIELEEDVFDNVLPNSSSKEDAQSSNPSQSNSSQNTSSENNVSKENQNENTSSSTSSETSSENTPSEQTPIVDDGVITLPVDRFN